MAFLVLRDCVPKSRDKYRGSRKFESREHFISFFALNSTLFETQAQLEPLPPPLKHTYTHNRLGNERTILYAWWIRPLCIGNKYKKVNLSKYKSMKNDKQYKAVVMCKKNNIYIHTKLRVKQLWENGTGQFARV